MPNPLLSERCRRFLKTYGVPVSNVRFIRGNAIAYTDGVTVCINPENYITRSFVPLVTKYLSLVGFKGHELGHCLFTDFDEGNKYFKSLQKGEWYPRKRKPSRSNAEIEEKLTGVVYIAKEINNILEDLYVEYKVHTNPQLAPFFSEALVLNNQRMDDLAPSVAKDFEEQSTLPALINLLLRYCKNEHFWEEVPKEYESLFEDMKKIVNTYCLSDNPESRFVGTNELVCLLFPYIEQFKEEGNEESSDKSDGSGSSSGSSSDDGGEKAADKLRKSLGREREESTSSRALSEELKEKLKGSPESTPDGSSSESLSDGSSESSSDGSSKGSSESSTESSESSIGTSSTGSTEHFGEDGGSEDKIEKLKKAISEAVDKLSDKKDSSEWLADSGSDELAENLDEDKKDLAEIQEGEKLTEEYERLDGINKGRLHAGVPIVFERKTRDEAYDFTDKYRLLKAEVSSYSKAIARALAQKVKERQNVGVKHSVCGKRFVANRAYRDDMTFFDNKSYVETPGLSICLLVDCSGSMCMTPRIETARTAAVTLYEFVKLIPEMEIGIYGHTTRSSYKNDRYFESMMLESFVEFDKPDKLDGQRLASISAQYNNRDGQAVKVCAEKLLTRPYKNKLFILISDGRPAAHDYGGKAAEQELFELRKHYEKLGIKFIAAAIGADKDIIEKIYGQKAFLDIQNLSVLPRKLVNICSEMMLQNL